MKTNRWLALLLICSIPIAVGGCAKKPAERKPIPPGEHVVTDGEGLSHIALKAYGDFNLWPYLLNANPQVKGRPRFLLETGETIIVPEKAKLDRRPPTPVYPKALPGDYIVMPDDSLPAIAKGCYGDENLWMTIYEANRGKLSSKLKDDPRLQIPGEVLHIPAKQSREEEATQRVPGKEKKEA